jgi:hypothetical protein
VGQPAAQDLVQHHDHQPVGCGRAADRIHRDRPGAQRQAGWRGPFFDFLNERLDFGVLGYIIVGIFLVAWLVSVALWKLRRVEDRYGDAITDATQA